ncbi:MAG: kelch motif-containing protein, partial [Thermoplasmata archaeon]|nr:kelch motif-containing protein [Thermoplasmata archaeon]
MDALIATANNEPNHAVGIILVTVMLGLSGAGSALAYIAVHADAESAGWSSFPSMAYPRAWPEVVSLPSGNIVAIGGLSVNGPTATTEVFDPDGASWSPGPTMT